MPERMERAFSEIGEYGRRSATGLDSMRKAMVDALANAPEWAHEAAGMVNPMLPGYGTMESLRMGRQAGRDFNLGNYADALGNFANALDAPFNDVMWLIPETGAYRAFRAAVTKK